MKIDLHTHSKHSGDNKMEIKDLVKTVKAKGLDGFALTDHNSIKGIAEARKLAKKEGLEFIPGIETSTTKGHILGLGMELPILYMLEPEEAIEIIHEAGGVAIAAHPFDRKREHFGDFVRELRVDGLETKNGKTIYFNRTAEKVCREMKVAETGGSDAHEPMEIGNAWTEYEGDLITAVKKRKTKSFGGFGLSAVGSMVIRRFKGVPLKPKV